MDNRFSLAGKVAVVTGANGTFGSFIDVKEAATIQVSNVNITNIYHAHADARTTQALGGAAISANSTQTNVAEATTATRSNAGIGNREQKTSTETQEESGDDADPYPAVSIEASVVSILNDGTATAYAGIAQQGVQISGINVAVSVLTSTVNADQLAQLSGANVTAASVSVESRFNDGTKEGAVAELGSLSSEGLSASLVGVNTNVLTANMNAANKAMVSGSILNVTSGLAVHSISKSYANAATHVADTSLGLANIGAVIVNANANGSFAATVENGTEITAATMDIRNDYEAASSAVAEQPKVAITAAAGMYNGANATTGAKSCAASINSKLTATGKDANGISIYIDSDGNATAYAAVTAPHFS